MSDYKDNVERRVIELETLIQGYLERNNNCFEYTDDYEPLSELEQDELNDAMDELERMGSDE
jgi:hypothetical protein